MTRSFLSPTPSNRGLLTTIPIGFFGLHIAYPNRHCNNFITGHHILHYDFLKATLDMGDVMLTPIDAVGKFAELDCTGISFLAGTEACPTRKGGAGVSAHLT
jgi:hypothetical protein